jgi:hypothetical protein
MNAPGTTDWIAIRVVGCSAVLGGRSSATLLGMTIKAHVRSGRLVLDEPADLPEGAESELLPLDPGDWLDDTGRAAWHQALRESDVLICTAPSMSAM